MYFRVDLNWIVKFKQVDLNPVDFNLVDLNPVDLYWVDLTVELDWGCLNWMRMITE